MLKAYLAHSSEDKSFVLRVANLLGRPSVMYDNMYFQPGVDLLESINSGLDKSRLFVFFISRNSLRSFYVNHEITEAKWRILEGKMSGAVTISIDRDLDLKQLPDWMRRTLIKTISSPSQAASIIRKLLLDQDYDVQMPFVGREQDLAECSRKLIVPPEGKAPRILAVSGLDGIGRKRFATRALKDYLGFDTISHIILEETASLDSLHLRLLEETGDMYSRKDLASAIGLFSQMTSQARGQEIARLLSLLGQSNQVPLIVDHNVLLDDQGRYQQDFMYVLIALADYQDTYITLIQNRRPDISNLPDSTPGIAYKRLDPLKLEDSELLIQQLFRKMKIQAEIEKIKSLAMYVSGYPPAIKIISSLVKFYGLDVMLADKSTLTDVQYRTFAPVLGKLNLSDKQWEILRLLADLPSLPFDVIVEAIEIEAEECSVLIRQLIDLSLVLPDGGDCSISPPIQRAVVSVRGSLSRSEYDDIANRLIKTFWKIEEKVPRLNIVNATIYTLARGTGKGLLRYRDLIIPSQLYKVAKAEYDSQNWGSAIDFGMRTLELDPSRVNARVILCKALIRKERWVEAENQIRHLQEKGSRAQFYCKGFLEWKRGDLGKAVSAFESALAAGDRSVSVYRDLSHCLFRLGRVTKAKEIFKGLPEWALRNRYIIDLAAQIAIAEKNWLDAERFVSELEHVSSRERYYHRRATLKVARGLRKEALDDIEIACTGESKYFEAMAQKADILIELEKYPEAEDAVNQLEPLGSVKRDVKTGLTCKMLIRQRKWREAEIRWEEINQKELPVHQNIRRDILIQKVADKMISPLERKESERLLTEIVESIQLPLVVSEDETLE